MSFSNSRPASQTPTTPANIWIPLRHNRYRFTSSCFPSTVVLVCGRIYGRFLAESCELLQPGVFLVREFVRASRFKENAGGVSDRTGRHGAESIHDGWRLGQYLGAGTARHAVFHQRQPGVEPRST